MSQSVAIIIGRWQILQRGHETLLRAALACAPKVIVVIGSAHRARDAHNPFSWQERQQQFETVLTAEERQRVDFLPVRDYYDDQRWTDAVRAGVAKLVKAADITLVGFKKDHTSAYLDLFPGWQLVEVQSQMQISASDLRSIYFEASSMHAALTVIGNYVSPGVKEYLEAWSHLPAYRFCAAEHRAQGEAVFDHPSRSPRGRIITMAFDFDLSGSTLPEVRGQDDASRARWIPRSQLPQIEEQLFEDHACIVDHFPELFPPL